MIMKSSDNLIKYERKEERSESFKGSSECSFEMPEINDNNEWVEERKVIN